MSLETENNKHELTPPRTGVRFIHTADLHLDSPLRSLALRDPALAQLVETATRTTLIRIVDLCIEEAVDALLIAGDLYDSDQNSMHTAALLINQMRRLQKADIAVFIIRGNHDSQAAITKRLSLPDNVHVFNTSGESVKLPNTNAIIHGISFGKKHIPESLLPKFAQPLADHINIGMLHTSLNGSAQHDEYAPCTVTELDEFGYAYWALGHIHKRSVQGKETTIVMPGIPQGRDVGETGPGTISLVCINDEDDKGDAQSIHIETHVVGPAQFELIEINLSPFKEWNEAINFIQDKLKELRNKSFADQLIVRISLVGTTSLHFKLIRDNDLLVEVLKEYCNELGNLWIEKLQCDTQTADSNNQVSTNHDALPDLSNIIENNVMGSALARQQGLKEIELFVKKLPSDVKHLFGETEQQRIDIIDKLMREGSSTLLQKISYGDESESTDA